VPWPKIPKRAALIKVGACGVCGTDLHILKGHWPKKLPWPFTLGHEIGGVLVEVGADFTEDFMSKPLRLGSKVMIPPLMPCGHCYYCTHYPLTANKCLTPVYYGRYLGFDKAPHLWGGWANMSMSISTCCPVPRSTTCPTTCRCGSARCRSR
jgi:D-arabinose 1-dehydrogenase-like Zn-dependent alcohol dehydrogenase